MRLRVLVPVFNDWESFSILLRALDLVAARLPCVVTVTAIDDGSTKSAAEIFRLTDGYQFLSKIEIVRLAVNVGHQRAIAVGLCIAADAAESDAVLIMDSDGEDPPEAIEQLLARAAGREEFCVVAARRKRSESWKFKASYLVYKTIFKLVTGKKIGFGNFSLISAGYARRLEMLPDLWNNLPAAVLRSRLPIDEVLVDRGKRYAGKSQMNFTSLIVHGFSAISVYADTIFVRLLIATIGLVAFSVIAVATVLGLRLFVPAHATPGWATTVTLGLTIILMQLFFVTLTSMLSLLNSRVQRLMLPIQDYKPYVRTIELVFAADVASVAGAKS
jgi:glycosyltransferase involved in cell wall biosynthesis